MRNIFFFISILLLSELSFSTDHHTSDEIEFKDFIVLMEQVKKLPIKEAAQKKYVRQKALMLLLDLAQARNTAAMTYLADNIEDITSLVRMIDLIAYKRNQIIKLLSERREKNSFAAFLISNIYNLPMDESVLEDENPILLTQNAVNLPDEEIKEKLVLLDKAIAQGFVFAERIKLRYLPPNLTVPIYRQFIVAHKDDDVSMNNLAATLSAYPEYMKEDGENVHWYKKAAERNNIFAMINLANFYARNKNFEEAENLLKKSDALINDIPFIGVPNFEKNEYRKLWNYSV